MSWFQTTNIASLAKTALKEAQRTIDKALEIGDSSAPTVSSSATIHTITEAPEKADGNTKFEIIEVLHYSSILLVNLRFHYF